MWGCPAVRRESCAEMSWAEIIVVSTQTLWDTSKASYKLPGSFSRILVKKKNHEIVHVVGVTKKSLPRKNPAYNASLDTTNAFLDRSWPKEGQQKSPRPNGHRDFEKSLLFEPTSYKKSWALLDVICPCDRITLDAKKALRIISNMCKMKRSWLGK